MSLLRIAKESSPMIFHLLSQSLKTRPYYLSNFLTCHTVITGMRVLGFEPQDSFERAVDTALSYLKFTSTTVFGAVSIIHLFSCNHIEKEANFLDNISWAALSVLAISSAWKEMKKQDQYTG